MPKIPDYSYKVRSGGQIGGRQAAYADIGTGESLAQQGDNLAGLGIAIHDRQEKDSMSEAQRILSQERNRQTLYLAEQERNPKPGFSSEYVQSTTDRAPKIVSDFEESRSSRRAKEHLQSGLADLYTETAVKAGKIDSIAKGAVAGVETKQTVAGAVNAAFADPTQRDNLIKETQNYISLHKYIQSDLDKQAFSQEASRSIFDGALTGKVEQVKKKRDVTVAQVDQVLAELKDPKQPWQKGSSDHTYISQISELNAFREHVRARNQDLYKAGFEEDMKRVAVGGPVNSAYTPAKIDANVESPLERQRLKSMYEDSTAEGNVRTGTKGWTDAQFLSAIRGAEKARLTSTNFSVDDAKYRALTSVYTKRAEEIKQDQGGYFARSEGVSGVYKNFVENRNPVTAQEFAQASIAEQKRINPGLVPVILPDSEVDAFKAEMDRVKEQPDQALQSIQTQKEIWGQNWDKVTDQLFSKGGMNEYQYVASTMADDPGNRTLARSLLQAGALKDKEVSDALPEAERRAAQENAISVGRELRNAFISEDPVRGFGKANAFEMAATRLAIIDGDPSKASEYYNRMVGSKYRVAASNGVALRIPVKTGVKEDQVLNWQAEMNQSLEKRDLYIPYANSLSPEDAKKRYIELIRGQGSVVNFTGDTGVLLRDSAGNAVLENVNGHLVPITAPWEDVAKSQPRRTQRMMGSGKL